MILRPYGVVLDGQLELGLEVVLHDGVIAEVRPHTGIPERFVLSPAFVNAHSHLEYRGMQDKISATEYWPWIRELTQLKMGEAEVRVRREAITAAHENHRTGVGLMAEHSDRPVAATAMLSAGLDGVIFQETITFFEQHAREEKLGIVRRKATEQANIFRKPVYPSPHAYHTVDRQTLADFGRSRIPISIHVAETEIESQFTRDGSGPIGDFYRTHGFEVNPTGKDVVPTLFDLGIARPGAQFIHCCDVSEYDIRLLAQQRVSVAHCPRSNTRLRCPTAPVREMLDMNIKVGLGLDSPASGGPIDMFAEMREALKVSEYRGRALSAREVWRMATNGGAASLRFALPELADWEIRPGLATPLIRIAIPDATRTEDLILAGAPFHVSWV